MADADTDFLSFLEGNYSSTETIAKGTDFVTMGEVISEAGDQRAATEWYR